jgi:hypothetical protein
MQAVLFIVFIKTKSAQILQSKFPNYSDWYYRQRNMFFFYTYRCPRVAKKLHVIKDINFFFFLDHNII